MLGPVSIITFVVILLQLSLFTIVLINIDELLQKGHGISQQSSLIFLLGLNTTGKVFLDLLSVKKSAGPNGIEEVWGILWATFSMPYKRPDKIRAIWDVFYRSTGPNLWQVLVTLALGCTVAYFNQCKSELPVMSAKARRQSHKWPIKLLYTGNMSLVLLAVFLGNYHFFSQVIYKR